GSRHRHVNGYRDVNDVTKNRRVAAPVAREPSVARQPVRAAAGRELRGLHAIRDGVVPEAVETLERAVHLAEFLAVDPADLLDRADMALVEAADDIGDLLTLRRQAHAHRTTID